MPNHSKICLNMPQYVWMCLNLPKWLLFYMSQLWFLFYLNTWLLISTVYSLKEHEAVSLNRKNLTFFIVAESILLIFCFRLNTFTSKISNFLLPFGTKDRESTMNIRLQSSKRINIIRETFVLYALFLNFTG